MALLAPEDYPDSLGKSSLFSEVMDKYSSGLRRRADREAEWYVAREFLRGNHYNVWVPNRGIVSPPREAKPRNARLVYNKTRVGVETIIAYLLKQSPTFTVNPNTGEYEDQAAALQSRRILYNYWYLLNLLEKLEPTGLWASISAGFWRIGWNPLAGPKIPTISQVEIPSLDPLVPSTFKEVITGHEPGGEVRVDVCSPFEIIPDDGATTIDDSTHILQVTTMPVRELRSLHPGNDHLIVADRAEEMTWGQRILNGLGLDAPKGRGERCVKIEYWARPDSEHPDGLWVTATKKGVLSAKPTPQGYDHIPYAMWPGKIVPGEFWPDGLMKDAIPLQKELNRRISQAVDIANRFKMKWVAQKGTIDAAIINNEDGEVIEYETRAPSVERPPDFPDSLVKLISMSSEAIDDVIGSVAVLQGKNDGETRSGRQVHYQGQYGETRINRMAARLAGFLSRAGKLILMQVQANVSETRQGKVAGKSRSMDVFYFQGADIKNNTDVTVDTGSLLGFTSTERFDKIMMLADKELVPPDKLVELLEMEDFRSLAERNAQDRNVARRENEMWRYGKPVRAPFYFEKHEVHIEEHDSYRKSADYEAKSPEERARIDLHCQAHEQAIAAATAFDKAQDMGAGAPGEPGSLPGGPGSPGAVPPPNPESGQEIAEGLPPVPELPDSGPEQPPGGM